MWDSGRPRERRLWRGGVATPLGNAAASARAARGRSGRDRKSSGISGMLREARREKGPPLLGLRPEGGA